MALSFNGKEVKKVKFNNSDVNYVIKDGKLVWANPNLYLKSSGTQYINTELVADGNTTYEIKLKRGEGANSWFFGQDGGYAVNAHGIIYYENSGAWFYGNKDNGTTLDKDVIYILKSETKDNKYIRTINSNPFMSNDISSFSSPGTFILFGHFRGGVAISKELSIYYSKMFQNDNLIQHFVPVRAGLKIGDYTVPSNGMWDIVSQQFFGNSGTGEFSYGKDE